MADTDPVIIEYPREMFMVKRPADKPVIPAVTLGTRTVQSAEEQAAAEAEGWYADPAAATAAADLVEEPVEDATAEHGAAIPRAHPKTGKRSIE